MSLKNCWQVQVTASLPVRERKEAVIFKWTPCSKRQLSRQLPVRAFPPGFSFLAICTCAHMCTHTFWVWARRAKKCTSEQFCPIFAAFSYLHCKHWQVWAKKDTSPVWRILIRAAGRQAEEKKQKYWSQRLTGFTRRSSVEKDKPRRKFYTFPVQNSTTVESLLKHFLVFTIFQHYRLLVLSSTALEDLEVWGVSFF